MPKSIMIEGLQKRYKDIHAVRGVSFDVEQGEIFGIVGPNGAGKTTTIEIMEGLRKGIPASSRFSSWIRTRTLWSCASG